MSLKLIPASLTQGKTYDYVIIGSGFGGSVSAMRLSEKGYKVLVIEKGGHFEAKDFAKTNWDLKRWMWNPKAGLRGIFQMMPLQHVNVVSGTGVGGGSLTYGATLPTPKPSFFKTGSWANLQDWEKKLAPHYDTALKMLGATTNPHFTDADHVMEKLAKEIGREDHFHATRVGIFFSDKEKIGTESDPYFDGEGPERSGCVECGACMVGCRHNAKNTLDKNYLYFANKLGADIISDNEVTDVQPAGKADGSEGYFVSFTSSFPGGSEDFVVSANKVIFSGGVMGTIPLLHKLKDEKSLPNISDRLGDDVRTNNETLTTVTTFDKDKNFAQGVCIGSIINTDDHSHLEPINYNEGSGIWRLMMGPRAQGNTFLARVINMITGFIKDPVGNLKVLFTPNWSRRTIFLMFMQHLDSTISFKRGKFGQLKSVVKDGAQAPAAYIPESQELTERVEKIINGKAAYGISEVFTGAPSTGHILGGAPMGANASEGVINDKGEVFGYKNLYVCDGSAVSANPGVNPSLSITALTEWFMSNIEPKAAKTETSHSEQTPSEDKKPARKTTRKAATSKSKTTQSKTKTSQAAKTGAE